MQKCQYCNEEQELSTRHEPNCRLNPYFQNRIYSLPKDCLRLIIDSNDPSWQLIGDTEWHMPKIK